MAGTAYLKRCMAEGLGTGLLLTTVVGSGSAPGFLVGQLVSPSAERRSAMARWNSGIA